LQCSCILFNFRTVCIFTFLFDTFSLQSCAVAQRKTTKRAGAEVDSTNKRNMLNAGTNSVSAAVTSDKPVNTEATSQQVVNKAPIGADKLPASIKNIHRLSSVDNQQPLNEFVKRFYILLLV
jgi:hypothetical protein